MNTISNLVHRYAWLDNPTTEKLQPAAMPRCDDASCLQNLKDAPQWPGSAVPMNHITDELRAVALAHGRQTEVVAKR